MNIDYIEDYIKVAECRSLNHASSLLNISTPALSKRIKQVETYFGCQLFYRTSRGIFLNKNGELVLEKFLLMKKELESLKKLTTASNETEIKIGLLPSFSLYKLDNNIQQTFGKGISIKIESNTHNLLEHLYNGDIDLLIGDTTSIKHHQLSTKSLYKEPFMVVFSQHNLLNGMNSIKLGDILMQNIFVLNSPCDTLTYIKNAFSEHRLNLEYKSDLESIFASIKNNQGVTIIPQSLANKVEHMNLIYKPLAHYVREVGLIAYSDQTVDQVFNILKDKHLKRITP